MKKTLEHYGPIGARILLALIFLMSGLSKLGLLAVAAFGSGALSLHSMVARRLERRRLEQAA